uniref:Flotillin 1 n=1 Tax=Timema genevievae TaxID=629358 RepID=A0A7R9JZS2_TIMGE|nr:unnamed protein product [Timema genevievae]
MNVRFACVLSGVALAYYREAGPKCDDGRSITPSPCVADASLNNKELSQTRKTHLSAISLNTMTLQVESPTVYTSQGVPISVTGIAQTPSLVQLVCVLQTPSVDASAFYTLFCNSSKALSQVKIQGQNEEMLLAACEQFLGKSETEIQHIALVTLEGHQRAIMGSMTVEEIYKDRKKFSKQVFEVASSDLVNMGITVVSYTLKDIRDEEVFNILIQSKNKEGNLRPNSLTRDTVEGSSSSHSGPPRGELGGRGGSELSSSWYGARGELIKPQPALVAAWSKASPSQQTKLLMTGFESRSGVLRGYLKSLGMARTAEVKRDARIGEAEARKDAQIKEAIAEEERMASRASLTHCGQSHSPEQLFHCCSLKAEAEFAYELQAAKTKQRIKEEQMQILVVERTQEILVQDQEIQRKERELEATVRRPAEAEKFRLEKLAEANGNRVILEAEAEAESLRVRGEAEAFAIEAKARAEAEQMIKKAEAWKEYKEAAMIDMLLDTLPKIAAEVAAPLSQAKKITMVSSGQGEVGASKLTGEVLSIMIKVPEVVKGLTGVDLVKSIHAA